MFTNRRSRRLGVVYAILIAFSLLLLGASSTQPVLEVRRAVGFAFSPIQQVLAGSTRSVTSIFGTFAEIDRLRQDHQLLSGRVQQLEAENRQLQALRRQNQQLSQLLGIRSALAFETITAEVIVRHMTQNERLVVIDKGSDDGLAIGDAVLAGGGALAGRVIDLGPGYAEVLLLSDSRFIVIGLVEQSRAIGEVSGRLSAPALMSNVPSTEVISVGEAVVTAGIDLGEGARSQFPRGLLIGEIVDVDTVPNDVVQNAQVVPAAPLDKLEYVLVVTDYDPPGPLNPDPTPEPGASPSPDGSGPPSGDPEGEGPSPSSAP